MKKKVFIFITGAFLLTIFLFQLKLINLPVQDNDEGIYTTTFLLINKGFSAYSQTFLSQPPGFLISVYPGFVLLGKTLETARLMVGLWSILGLISLIWIFKELKNKWAAFLAIGFLFLIPYYFMQTLVFQSDALSSSFSLIAFAFLLRFVNTQKMKWIAMSSIFLNLAFWTKFDYFLMPSVIIIFWFLFHNKQITKEQLLKSISTVGGISIIFFVVFAITFGIQNIFADTVALRLAAMHLQSPGFLLITYIKENILLFSLTVLTGLLLFSKGRKLQFPLLLTLIWLVTVFISLLIYKPLYPHHMIMFVVPLVLFFSLFVSSIIKKQKLFYVLVFSVFILGMINYGLTTFQKTNGILDSNQKKIAEVISKNTVQGDIVLTDEEILNAVTNRFPPSSLSDVSFVRINSQNLSADNFKQIITVSKPKLIIPLNGRLRAIKTFNEVLNAYKPLAVVNGKTIYIRR